MNVYILPISEEFQPPPMRIVYPKHNKYDYGIEQDFFRYLQKHPQIITKESANSDWHYLPIYWTRYHVNHGYGRFGLENLQNEIDKTLLDDEKTFTICQYADGTISDIGKTIVFHGSRKNDKGMDIPLLSHPHKRPLINRKKRYLASFVGRLSTHPVRLEMATLLGKRANVEIKDGNKGTSFFVRQMLRSYVALCPRGYGGSSFRFYEAMQLGIVPLLISDIDTRPFKAFLNWNPISLYAASVEEAGEILDSCTTEDFLRSGELAREVWEEELAYGKWGSYVLKELERLAKRDA